MCLYVPVHIYMYNHVLYLCTLMYVCKKCVCVCRGGGVFSVCVCVGGGCRGVCMCCIYSCMLICINEECLSITNTSLHTYVQRHNTWIIRRVFTDARGLHVVCLLMRVESMWNSCGGRVHGEWQM